MTTRNPLHRETQHGETILIPVEGGKGERGVVVGRRGKRMRSLM